MNSRNKFSIGTIIVVLVLMNSFAAVGQVNPAREQLARRLVENLKSDQFQQFQDEIHTLLKPSFPVNQLSQLWNNVLVQLGEFEGIEAVTEAKNLGYYVVSVRCKFRRENATIEFSFNEDNKVGGFFIKP